MSLIWVNENVGCAMKRSAYTQPRAFQGLWRARGQEGYKRNVVERERGKGGEKATFEVRWSRRKHNRGENRLYDFCMDNVICGLPVERTTNQRTYKSAITPR